MPGDSALPQATPGGSWRARWLTPGTGAVRAADLTIVVGAVVLSIALGWAMQDALIDDVYITLGYARNLAENGQWGVLPDSPANTATSVLNVLMLGILTFVLRDPVVSLGVLHALVAAALAVGLLWLGRRWQVGQLFAAVALPMLMLSPLLASAQGMETMLAVATLVWLLERAAAGQVAGFGYLSGAAVLVRPDLVLVVAVIWLLHPQLRRPAPARQLLGASWRAAVVCVPWFVFSWLYFGTAVPDTLVLKTRQTWGDFALGWWGRYHVHYPEAVEATFVIAGLGLLATALLPLLRRLEPATPVISVAAGPAAGAALFGLYLYLDVPPYFWYYGLPVAGLTLALAFAAAAVWKLRLRGRPWMGRAVAGAVIVAAGLPTAYVWSDLLAEHAPLREAPVHGNWASTAEYRQVGLDLADRFGDRPVTIRSAGEFGTIQYFCECLLLDRFSERSLIDRWIEVKSRSSWLMRLNYLWFDADEYDARAQDFHLDYERGHVDERLHPDMWNVYSPTKGPGHFVLVPGPRPVDVEAGVTPS
jgi:hypothetical protein